MARAESSKDAENNGVKANTQGAPSNYELPWYECTPLPHATYSNKMTGSRNIARSSSTTLSATPRLSNA